MRLSIPQDAWILLGRLLQHGCQLALVVGMPLALGRSDYVEFSLVLPLVLLGVSVAFGWLNGTVHRYARSLLDGSDAELRETLVGYYAAAAIALTLGLLAAAASTSSLFALLPWLVLANALKQLLLGMLNMSRRHLLFAGASAAYAAALGVFLLLSFSTVEDRLSVNLLIYGALEIAVSLVICARLRARGPFRWPRMHGTALRKCIVYGLPLVLNAATLWVISLSDRYLMSLWTTADETASYILASQLAGSAIVTPMSFVVAVFVPRVLELDGTLGRTAALAFNATLFRYFRWAFVPLLMVLTAIVLIVLRIFYAEFEIAPLVVVVIVLAHLIGAASHFVNKEFELDGRTVVITRALTVGAVINFALNLVLIPSMAALGAAIATLVAYCAWVAIVYASSDVRFLRAPT
jgi:O-antigen/teichoic acid export membrane protein